MLKSLHNLPYFWGNVSEGSYMDTIQAEWSGQHGDRHSLKQPHAAHRLAISQLAVP